MRRTWIILGFALIALCASAQKRERVRFEVAGLFHSGQFTVEAASSQPLVMRAGDREFIIGQSGRQRVVLTRVGQRVLLHTQGIDVTANSVRFSRNSGDAEFTLLIPSRFRRRYHGELSVSSNGAELVPVVTMDLETAVASVLAAEATADTPLEALKALAVASRSYLVASTPRHHAADFCDTTHCQFLREPPPVNSPAARAASETQGLVMTFAGRSFAAMYSASCGGRTHALADLGLAQHDYPYYAVECPYCRRHPDRWSAELAEADASSAKHGERERLRLARKLGWNVVPSNNFDSRHTGDGVELNGVGHGHGLGLCERGAAAMAREGSDFRAILAHYYPNTVIDSLRE